MNVSKIRSIVAVMLSCLAFVSSAVYADVSLDNDLNEAAYKGDTKEVLRLLQQGAHVDAANKYGARAIDFAAMRGYTELARTLIDAGADVNQKSGKQGNTVLMHAAERKGNLEVLQMLIGASADVNATDNEGKTALFGACYSGNAEAVKVLLAAGAQIDHADKKGIQPIHFAVNKGYERSHTMGHEEVVKILLEAGAKIDAQDKNGWQPIHYAADGVNVLLVKFLVESGADINAPAIDGLTPLQIAKNRDVWGRVYRAMDELRVK
ncbi:ankyrin repeat domain-containing protein [Janthinobacterium sp. JC611]|uniref:ankyrin repeat domain-containing protein n=1 Tax=Janthinobacterium sp. JC611 TaxID=2816201 RepID=UPI001BFDFBAD|nr:ankyrin repeat domain-containing protein [Janthinobacterium sp. JC611]